MDRSHANWKPHRLAVFGSDAAVDAFVADAGRRTAVAWGRDDALFARLRNDMARGRSLRDLRHRAETILGQEAGIDLTDFVEGLPRSLTDVFEDRALLRQVVESTPTSVGSGSFTLEDSAPGLSLISLVATPHPVASLGLHPVGTIWRSDRWGTRHDVRMTSGGFGRRMHSGTRYRASEFLCDGHLPVGAFGAFSRRHPEILLLMTTCLDLPRTDGPSTRFASYAWSSDVTMFSRMWNLDEAFVEADMRTSEEPWNSLVFAAIERRFVETILGGPFRRIRTG